MTRTERNLAVLSGLHPPFALMVERWLAGQDALGLHVTLVQGRRTFAEQDALFQQGRTMDGPRVTNARAGFSFHNYGLAIDFLDVGLNDRVDQADWETTAYAEIVRPAVAMGMVWGGAWRKGVDRPHLEWHPGLAAWDGQLLIARSDNAGVLPVDLWADKVPSMNDAEV